MALAVLAGFDALAQRALDAVREAFVEPLGAQMREAARLTRDATEDPFRAMVEVARSRESQAFGDGFERPAPGPPCSSTGSPGQESCSSKYTDTPFTSAPSSPHPSLVAESVDRGDPPNSWVIPYEIAGTRTW